MRSRFVLLLALFVLVAPFPSVAAQISTAEDTAQDASDYLQEVEDYDVVQEDEEHYIVVIPLPASAFRPDVQRNVTVPAGELEVGGRERSGEYQIRIEIDPDRVEAGDATLWENVWQIEAHLEDEVWNQTLPALAEYEEYVDPTAQTAWETINETHEAAIELRRNLTELLAAGGPQGHIPGLPGSYDSALVRENVRLLNETIDQLNDTRSSIDELVGIWAPGYLDAANLTYAAVQAVTSDVESLTGHSAEAPLDVRETIRDIEDNSRDLRDSAYDRWRSAWELAQRVDNDTDGDHAPEPLNWTDDEEIEQLREQVTDLREELAPDDAPVSLPELPPENLTDDDPCPQVDHAGDDGEFCRALLGPCETGDRSDECRSDDNDTEDNDTEDEPTATQYLNYPPAAEDPADSYLDTLWEHTEMLRRADGGNYETTALFWELVNDTVDYAKEIDDNLASTMAWVNRTYDPWEDHARDAVNAELEAARSDLATVQDALLGGEDEECDPETEDCDSDTIGALQAVNDTIEEVNETIEAIEDSQSSLADDPQGFAEDRVDQITEHPTQLRVYLPKDVSEAEPTTPGVGDALGEEEGDDGNDTINETVNDTVEDPTNQPSDDDATDVPGVNEDEVEEDLGLGEESSEDDNETEEGNESQNESQNEENETQNEQTDEQQNEENENQENDRADDEPQDSEESQFSGSVEPERVAVTSGEQEIVSLTIENEGTSEDTYQLVAEHEGPFTVDASGDSETTIPAGDEDTLQVRVSPTGEGSGQLELTATSDAGGEQTWTVPVDVAGDEGSQAVKAKLAPNSLEIREDGRSFADVTVTNDGQQTADVEVAPKAKGPISASTAGPSTMEVEPGDERTATVEVAGDEKGSGFLQVEVTSGDSQLTPAMSVDVVDDDEGPAEASDDSAGEPQPDEADSGEDSNDAPFPTAAWLAAAIGAAVLVRTRQEK